MKFAISWLLCICVSVCGGEVPSPNSTLLRGSRDAATPSSHELGQIWNGSENNTSVLNRSYPLLGNSRLLSCMDMWQKFKKDWSMRLYRMEFGNGKVTGTRVHHRDATDGLRKFLDPETQNIEITRKHAAEPCKKKGGQVVWFYPQADHNGAAFDLNDHVCRRLQVFAEDEVTTCLNIYRVANVGQISTLLDAYVAYDSISHAVLGGHGNQDIHGVLQLGNEGGRIGQNAATDAMLKKLASTVVDRGTIFLDSCWSAINGLAPYVSDQIPWAWIFGGVLSLDAGITVQRTRFPEGSNEGPPRIVSDKPSWGGGREVVMVFFNRQVMGFVSKYV